MATNYRQPGDSLDWTNGTGSDVASGQLVAVGNTVGVALTDIADGASGVVGVEGVWEVAKATGTAWALGESVDYDVSAGNFGKGITPATGDVTKAGICAKAAGSAEATAWVKLTPGVGTLN
jgi:predicted RecA/RadA family phage recombinase